MAAVHRTYQAAQYDDVVAALPAMLAAVEGFPCRPNGERREALLAYVSAYAVAAKLVTKLGAGDLALLAADRAATAAIDAESRQREAWPVIRSRARLLQAEQVEDAERLAVGLAEELTRHIRSDHPSLVSVAGALWLIAAISAARRTDRVEAWARLDRANELAGLLGEDGNHAWTAFGPTNVAVHRVSVAAELGDAGEALRADAEVDVDRLPAGLLSRRAQVNVDLAWAQAQRRRDAEATLHLLEAERIAPQVIRHNVIAQEIVREMLSRGTGRRRNSSPSWPSGRVCCNSRVIDICTLVVCGAPLASRRRRSAEGTRLHSCRPRQAMLAHRMHGAMFLESRCRGIPPCASRKLLRSKYHVLYGCGR